jgi:hypothetical protein
MIKNKMPSKSHETIPLKNLYLGVQFGKLLIGWCKNLKKKSANLIGFHNSPFKKIRQQKFVYALR